MMNRLGLLAAACATVLGASTASGVLTNQYTFNTNANDSVGSAHGTVVVPSGVSRFVGGQLDFTRNNGVPSNAPDAGAYVNLPNGIASAAIGGGTPNQATFEMWVTVQENRFWARLFDFGGSNGGEDTSQAGNEQDYLMFVPQGFDNTYGFESHPAFAGDPGIAGVVVSNQPPVPLTTGVQHHIVVTYNQSDTTAGPGGTAKVYLNNAAPIVGAISANMPLGSIGNEVNSWLGRAQWPDPLIDGLYNEFRIYNHALSAAEVAASNTAGPVVAPIPSLTVNRDTGVVTIKNTTGAAQSLTNYSITSAAGGLNIRPLWDPIAPASGWTVQTETDVELKEGGTALNLGAGGSLGLGDVFKQSPFEDINFFFTLSGGATGFGTVTYEGNGGVAFGRSDFDADGTVDIDDWVAFLDGNGDNLAGLSDVAQYLKGDLNGDNSSNFSDFLIFRGDYIADNSVAAWEALSGGVPEPSSVVLAAAASLAIAAVSARRRR